MKPTKEVIKVSFMIVGIVIGLSIILFLYIKDIFEFILCTTLQEKIGIVANYLAFIFLAFLFDFIFYLFKNRK
ncbi:MAG: hypothetical protein COZ18_16975 [Flexibacter sp. CG_4_10_14_3_um_filter_32_15]|nr:MAG: hypothetical protein COZ18_16975 [Flexibacter sp. CG_4_10_14_3_um_filter_32_15]